MNDRRCAHWQYGCHEIFVGDGRDNWWLCAACRGLQSGDRRVSWANCTCSRCPSR